MLNWNRNGVKKDWSFTAWGTKYDVEVSHSDSNLETAHMPMLGDGKRMQPVAIDVGAPDPIPPPACIELDNGATDPYGDGCLAYLSNPAWCGGYDDDDFISNQMCCACGGGNNVTCKSLHSQIGGSDNKISRNEFYNNEHGYGKGW